MRRTAPGVAWPRIDAEIIVLRDEARRYSDNRDGGRRQGERAMCLEVAAGEIRDLFGWADA